MRVYPGSEGVLYTFCALRVAGGPLARVVSFFYACANLDPRIAELRQVLRPGLHSARRHLFFYAVCALLQVEAGRLANLVGAVTLQPNGPAVAAGHSDYLACTQQARAL